MHIFFRNIYLFGQTESVYHFKAFIYDLVCLVLAYAIGHCIFDEFIHKCSVERVKFDD